MNGIYIIDKDYGVTSRDIVNKIVKICGTKKVGHTGTLDPIATGVLIVCVGNATKLVNYLTNHDKAYEAEVILGTKTDTLDITGNIIKEEKTLIKKDDIISVLENFKGNYIQEVPIYSAVKVNGKKLYEYARNNEAVVLPKRNVSINDIELIDDIKYENDKTIFKFKCNVSKGTYIRALINDIAKSLNTIGTMKNLKRISVGKFNIKDSIKVEDINEYNIISIKDVIDSIKVNLNDDIKKKVLNGCKIDNIYNSDEVLFVDNNEAIALYRKCDDSKLKPLIMFKGGDN